MDYESIFSLLPDALRNIWKSRKYLIEELLEVLFVFEEGKAVQTEVETGISDFERIEILNGVTAGQKIITRPFLAVSKRLKDGEAVSAPDKYEEKEESEEIED